MELFIGNKNYSSWSLRPWLLMKHFDLPFTERMVGVAGRGPNDLHRGYSQNGLVPCLHLENEFQIWDTLAIAEFLAESFPAKHLWPADRLARARARSVSAEMHSGFGSLRGARGMNIKMRLQGAPLSAEVASDVARIDQIWTEARRQFGASSDQPYLLGAFSVADAMFAPVIWRFHSYNVLSTPSYPMSRAPIWLRCSHIRPCRRGSVRLWPRPRRWRTTIRRRWRILVVFVRLNNSGRL